MDESRTLVDLKVQVRCFVRERDWEQFHFPKDLAIGLAIEAAELLEHFRFRSNEEIAAELENEAFIRDIGHELADVLYFVLLMGDKLGFELSELLAEKLRISASRYPVERARGSNAKYTRLREAKEDER